MPMWLQQKCVLHLEVYDITYSRTISYYITTARFWFWVEEFINTVNSSKCGIMRYTPRLTVRTSIFDAKKKKVLFAFQSHYHACDTFFFENLILCVVFKWRKQQLYWYIIRYFDTCLLTNPDSFKICNACIV